MQVLLDLDAEILRRLEKVAPGKNRKRSAFIRAAIQKSLWEVEEEKTRRAYLAEPDGEPAPFDPTVWEPLPYGGFEPPASLRKRASTPGRRRTKRKKGRREGSARARQG